MGASQSGGTMVVPMCEVKRRLNEEQTKELEAVFRSIAEPTKIEHELTGDETDKAAKEPMMELTISREDFMSEFDARFKALGIDIGRIFDVMDISNDGRLSMREFMSGMFVFHKGTEAEKCQLLFRLYDRDGNGEISLKELTKMMWNSAVRSQNVIGQIPSACSSRPSISEYGSSSSSPSSSYPRNPISAMAALSVGAGCGGASGGAPGRRSISSSSSSSSSKQSTSTLTPEQRKIIKASQKQLKKKLKPKIERAARDLFADLDKNSDGRISFEEWIIAAKSNETMRRWLGLMDGDLPGTTHWSTAPPTEDGEVNVDDLFCGIVDDADGASIAGVLPEDY